MGRTPGHRSIPSRRVAALLAMFSLVVVPSAVVMTSAAAQDAGTEPAPAPEPTPAPDPAPEPPPAPEPAPAPPSPEGGTESTAPEEIPPTTDEPVTPTTPEPVTTTPPSELPPSDVPDDDGVSAAIEDGAPNGGDGNGDGIPDSTQANVASLPSALDVDHNGARDDYITVESPALTSLAKVRTLTVPSDPAPPQGVEFPSGLVDYDVLVASPGAAATVRLHLPAGGQTSVHMLQNGTWSDFTRQSQIDDGANEVALRLVDGGAGDENGADGVIHDPVGVGELGSQDLDIGPLAVGDAGTITLRKETIPDAERAGVHLQPLPLHRHQRREQQRTERHSVRHHHYGEGPEERSTSPTARSTTSMSATTATAGTASRRPCPPAGSPRPRSRVPRLVTEPRSRPTRVSARSASATVGRTGPPT